MNAYDLRPNQVIRLGEHEAAPTVTVDSRSVVQPWNDEVAVIFKEIPMTFYFKGTDQFNVVSDWHSSPLTHSYA